MSEQSDDEFLSQAFGVQLNKPFPAKTWEPQPDISAHELALCMPFMFTTCQWPGADAVWKLWDSLPPEARRHFKDVQP